MKKLLSLLACLSLLFAFGATDVMAMGIGLGLNQGSGDADIEIDGFSAGTHDLDTSDIGFVLDTNLSRENTFNYRLTVASSSFEIDDWGLDADGISFTNDFGFGLVKNEDFRLWLGPELKFGWVEGTDKDNWDYDLFSFGIGPALGANFNIGPTFTIALKAAYLIQTTNGEVWIPSFGWYDYSSDDSLFIIGVNLMFRLNEGY